MKEVREDLMRLADPEYAAFEAKLAPTVPAEKCLGVRVPRLREYAKELKKSPLLEPFLQDLPHDSYDENLLHAILLESSKGFEETLTLVEAFLPYVDNWAACDTLRPKVFGRYRVELRDHISRWLASPLPYTRRFGIDMLMTYYLDEDFTPEYLEWAAGVPGEEYYVRMMVAWYFATALAKQWDTAIPYIEQGRLPLWTHNKTIQKAIESYRITPAQKEFLRTLKK